MRSRRRGISTVVTSVMLVSAVSLMGAFMVSWSSSTFASKQLNISKSVDDRVNQIKESYVLEDVWFYSNSTASYAKVTVRNTGDISISISNIYLNNTQVWTGHQTVAKTDIQSITFQSSWGAGKTQAVWIKTERGGEVKQSWKA